ncbi:MAG: hypothetical protein ACKO71_08390 [Betaproteobacteria bacterium]
MGTTPEMLSSAGVDRQCCPPSETRWTAMVKAPAEKNPMLSWHGFMSTLALKLQVQQTGANVGFIIQHTNTH